MHSSRPHSLRYVLILHLISYATVLFVTLKIYFFVQSISQCESFLKYKVFNTYYAIMLLKSGYKICDYLSLYL